MEIVRGISADRRLAHIQLSEKYLRPGQERDFLWRLIYDQGQPVAIVQKRWGEIQSPKVGTMVRFEIETLAQRKTKGKSRPILNYDDRKEFIIDRLFKNGILAKPDSINIIERRGLMDRDGARFSKSGSFFTGTAMIINEEQCTEALRGGIGDAKCYGYGLLTLEELK